MNKKHILKDFPELPTGDVFKTIQMKEIETPQEHEISTAHDTDFKTMTKFLWLPKTIDGETKWLVTASWQEQFVEAIDQEAMDSGASTCLIWVWKPVKWL